jgi:hypothetical protein
MAEYCLKCFNEQNGTSYTRHDVVLSREHDICEGCASWEYVVVRLAYGFWIFRW